MTITNKEIIETILEVQSHSGLPIKTFSFIESLLKDIQKFSNHYNVNKTQVFDNTINRYMIRFHKNRRKSINKNIKSYDW